MPSSPKSNPSFEFATAMWSLSTFSVRAWGKAMPPSTTVEPSSSRSITASVMSWVEASFSTRAMRSASREMISSRFMLPSEQRMAFSGTNSSMSSPTPPYSRER